MPLSLKHVNEDAAWPIPKLRFDVASIKPSVPGIKLVSELQPLPGGRISARNMSLNNLIGVAYRLKPFQITGGPSWLGSISYDIEAKPDNPAKAGAWQTMLPTLLADRFRLQFHRETKELPVYALVPAHKDGKPGPGLKLAKEASCADRNFPLRKRVAWAVLRWWERAREGFRSRDADRGVADVLSRVLDRPVLDKTGLTGKFDFEAQFAPTDGQAPDSPNPSLFAALQEQLGLTLEPQKGQVEIFVIGGAQKPTEN